MPKVRRAAKRQARKFTLRVTNGMVRRLYMGVTTNPARKAGKVRGRPPGYQMPERIDAKPERTADVVLRAKPKRVYKYQQDAKKPAETE